jgi:hypothetical protein
MDVLEDNLEGILATGRLSSGCWLLHFSGMKK